MSGVDRETIRRALAQAPTPAPRNRGSNSVAVSTSTSVREETSDASSTSGQKNARGVSNSNTGSTEETLLTRLLLEVDRAEEALPRPLTRYSSASVEVGSCRTGPGGPLTGAAMLDGVGGYPTPLT